MQRLLLGVACGALFLPAAASAHTRDLDCFTGGCAETIFPTAMSQSPPAAGAVGVETPRFGPWGYDLSARDTRVRPGDDFFRYANGAALAAFEIPADRSRYGSFDLLSELSDNRLKLLVSEMAANPSLAPGSDEAKVRDLYLSYIDDARVEQLDASPLAPMLAEIRAATSRQAIARYMGTTMRRFGGSLFAAQIGQDAKHPDRYAVHLGQAGLGMPDRDYYLSANFADKKTAYQSYVAQILTLGGWANAERAAADIVAFETRIAEGHWTRTESRDDDKTYNPMTLAELKAAAPGFDWDAWMEGASLDEVERIIAIQNTALPREAAIFAETPVETLQAWQAFHAIDQAAPLLSKRFADAAWRFRAHVMQGAVEPRTRDKRAVSFAAGTMGEALGRAYVARWFPPENKAKMEELVANLKRAMSHSIDNLAWMTPETKARAQEKLAKFGLKIGYPSKWRDYSALDVRPDDLFGNSLRSRAFEWAFQVGRLNGPVDREEWQLLPQDVNAYYTQTNNEIVFPAAILQPPFFDPDGDPAINYGGIGAVIGHEIGHGFDDQGRKSDGDGVLRDWWTPADAAAFVARTTVLGAQYDAFEPLPGFRVQGGLTMGENIGDAIGITVGLEAYHLSLDGRPAPVIDGLTGDQRFFLGWAQVWKAKYRDASMQQLVAADPHSPPEFRVIGPLRNSDAWYEAFNVQPGDRYYLAPADRVRIW